MNPFKKMFTEKNENVEVPIVPPLPDPVFRTQVVLRPVEDAGVLTPSTVNFGKDAVLKVGGSSPAVWRSFLKFDLSGISGTVRSAALRLTPVVDGNGTVQAWRTSVDTWTETTIHYANMPENEKGLSNVLTVLLTVGAPLVLPLFEAAASIALYGGKHDALVFAGRETGTPPELVLEIAG